jgi:hypothetical protein
MNSCIVLAGVMSVQAAAVGDGSCCFCWELLVSAAVMQLSCAAGHFVHVACAQQRIKVRQAAVLTLAMVTC